MGIMGKNDPGHVLTREHPDVPFLKRRLMAAIAEQELIPVLQCRVFDRLGDLGKEWAAKVRQDQADHRGSGVPITTRDGGPRNAGTDPWMADQLTGVQQFAESPPQHRTGDAQLCRKDSFRRQELRRTRGICNVMAETAEDFFQAFFCDSSRDSGHV